MALLKFKNWEDQDVAVDPEVVCLVIRADDDTQGRPRTVLQYRTSGGVANLTVLGKFDDVVDRLNREKAVQKIFGFGGSKR